MSVANKESFYEEGYDRGAFQKVTELSTPPVNRETPRESPRGVGRFPPVLARVYDGLSAARHRQRVRRERRQRSDWLVRHAPHAESTVLPAFRYLDLARYHYWFRSPNKAVQFAKIVREKNQWQAQHDGLYNALLLPLAKAITHRQRGFRSIRGAMSLSIPVVVLNSEIFEVDSSQEELTLRKVEHVSFFRKLDSASVKGEYLTEFVTLAGLRAFVSETAMSFVEQVARLVRSQPALFLEQRAKG